MNIMERVKWAALCAVIVALWVGLYNSPSDTPPPPPEQVAAQCPADAWQSFDRLDMKLPVDYGKTWRVVCKDVVTQYPATLPTGQFTVQSWVNEGTFYIFEWEVLTNA